MQLWQRGIHQVLDLRADKPQPVDQFGALVIDGTPCCPAIPETLRDISHPGDSEQRKQFTQQIAERANYSMRLVKSPLASPTKTNDTGVGKTRYSCPARAGKIGCPLVEGTTAAAR